MSYIVVKKFSPISLSDEGKKKINQLLPDLGLERDWMVYLPVEWLDHLAGPHSNLPTAKVCLEDAAKVACQAVYALEQAYSHWFWFKEECAEAPLDAEAHYYAKFYSDDAALRLYSAAEHLANFIVAYLDIPADKLSKSEKRSSLAVKVKAYLHGHEPKNLITKIIDSGFGKEWELVERYRNDWVHNKPPILDGPGVDYKRTSRWSTVGEAKVLAMGVTYTPYCTLAELLEAIRKSSWDLKNSLTSMIDLFYQEIETLGIKRDPIKGTITPPEDYWDRPILFTIK